MLKKLLSAIILLSCAFSNDSQDKKVVKKVMVVKAEANDEESVNINVNASVEDGMLTLSVSKNGKNHEFQIPVGNMDAMHVLKEELEDLDIDVNIHDLIGGGMEHGKQAMNKAHKMMKWAHKDDGAFLGVVIEELEGQLADYFGVKNGGVLVEEVMENSPAKKAGLKAGDVILKVDNAVVKSPKDLKRAISSFKPDTKVKLSILRKNRSRKISVTLGESPEIDFSFDMDHDFDVDDEEIMMFKMHDDDDPQLNHFMKKLPGMMNHPNELDQLKKELKALKKDVEELKKKSK